MPPVWAEQRDCFLLREALDRGHEVIAYRAPQTLFQISDQHVTWRIAFVSLSSCLRTSIALIVGRISNLTL